jgi:hypothetical protein
MNAPIYHNEKYIASRNLLISQAVKYANRRIRPKSTKGWKDKWNYAFHSKMNELWREQNNVGVK